MKSNVKTSNMVFERYEKKYRLSAEQYGFLMKALEPDFRMDRYGLHTICSLYLDTEDYRLIRHSLEKPAFKEKLRLRSYGVPAGDDTVYLELKKKFHGVTYKRRVPMMLREAAYWLERGRLPAAGDRNLGEIAAFLERQPLSPKVVLCYNRIALDAVDGSGIRMTVDRDLRWRDYSLDLGMGDHGAPLLGPGERILEVKSGSALPYQLCRLFSRLGIYPVSFSKYGTAYRDHLMNRREYTHAG